MDFSNVPGIVTLTNLSDHDIKILSQPGYTQGFTIKPGVTVKLLAEHSYELVAFYLQGQTDKNLKVVLPTQKV